ncbi:carboxylesterase family protein [Bradyrhizobium sp. U87765 SZCCT0131]|uniref:carboxylesterase/lipase family protein n=1 Tax=unclassified Bradyrhizobium TaxID=2631580 RepID=UPI001BACDEB5|nr:MULTISPECIES: carboxylesterase family protein [unclassified Bradyrhizobium]MBR1219841.1 carboxylesterase family protein [Bradyrhizobium sp. U87765 SZCCT0131]MBR1262492.1 carboxylesterase family protein [Bradyrhizobium sp. U87765 SZCCT0134]MBR1308325.1 carboxylesterase family protein [Bradyrhizobium sp. U87765 SZCCT0110]MBR1318274.1 carboxylesterase family protein [Bradyrhizobium sp. U87765 SZCCT0109]MBR1351977.1 carboxylesterase family protein [Bradyrhizobium sp. U87765 SZCCT0048]
MQMSTHPHATTPFGRFIGRRDGDVAVFRGIRYAQPPVGARRFARPVEMPLHAGDIDAGEDGPMPPQLPSRLENAMGPQSGAQGEDCLRLTIWRPADAAADERLPVLVWFHGGAFMTGAGSLPCYSGHALSHAERLVVVTVSSRLGPLGYARIPGVSDGNLGLHDQLASLRFVQRSIAGFGGDPDNVTIAGQSAGAFAVLALAVMPQARGLFRRAILQSGPFVIQPDAPERAEARGRLLAETVADGRADALREVAVDRIVAASGVVARQFASGPGDFTPPYLPCIDGELIQGPLLKAVADGAASWCPMIAGYTREECTVFAAIDPALATLDEAGLLAILEKRLGDDAATLLAEYQALRGRQRHPAALLSDVQTDAHFVGPTHELAHLQRRAGRPIHLFSFDWQSPRAGFGANHCLELPFLFGNRDAWADAPMVRGADDDDYAHLGATLRGYWGAFARTGRTEVAGLPPWDAYDDARTVMSFDRCVRPLSDPAGTRWRLAFRALNRA